MVEVSGAGIMLAEETEKGIRAAMRALEEGKKLYVILNSDGTLSRGLPDEKCDWFTSDWGTARRVAVSRNCVILHTGSCRGHIYRTPKDFKEKATYVKIFSTDGLPLQL